MKSTGQYTPTPTTNYCRCFTMTNSSHQIINSTYNTTYLILASSAIYTPNTRKFTQLTWWKTTPAYDRQVIPMKTLRASIIGSMIAQIAQQQREIPSLRGNFSSQRTYQYLGLANAWNTVGSEKNSKIHTINVLPSRSTSLNLRQISESGNTTTTRGVTLAGTTNW